MAVIRALILLVLVAVTFSAPLWEDMVPQKMRIGIWVVVVLASLEYLVQDVIRKRKAGKNWNEALSGNTKLFTGSVWLDGALFFLIILILIGSVAALFWLI